MQTACRSALCIVMAAVMMTMPVLAQTGEGATISSAKGTVTVNGKPAPSSAAVMNGDKVQTGDNSAANLTVLGSSAVLGARSAMTLQSNSIALDSGAISVSTEKGLGVQAANLSVSPALPGSSRYEVTRGNCQVTVAARRGDVTLSDGTTVKEGNTAKRAESPCAAAAGPPPAAAATGAGLSNGALAAIGLGAAAAAAAAALLSTGEPNVSPIRP